MKTLAMKIYISIVAAIAFSGMARADGTWVNCQRTNGYYQYFDTTAVQVGKDAGIGDLLGVWVTSYNPTAWTCTHRTAYEGYSVPLTIEGYPPYTIWGTLSVDGQSYNVYNTTVKAGLGYIARWRFTVQGQTSDWYPLTITNGRYQTPGQSFNVNHTGNSWNIGVDVQVRFVKTANTLTAGRLPVFDPMYMRHSQTYSGGTSTGTGTYMIADFVAGGLTISTTGGTCTTSDLNVELPPVSRSEFSGVGYTAARTDFNLNFTGCPAGLSEIGYMFTPTTSIIDGGNGVFALSGTSTASGVGLQLLNDNDVPVTFNSIYPLVNYDPGQDNANYTVPLRAGIYQTEEQVSSGNINGAVTFTLNYK